MLLPSLAASLSLILISPTDSLSFNSSLSESLVYLNKLAKELTFFGELLLISLFEWGIRYHFDNVCLLLPHNITTILTSYLREADLFFILAWSFSVVLYNFTIDLFKFFFGNWDFTESPDPLDNESFTRDRWGQILTIRFRQNWEDFKINRIHLDIWYLHLILYSVLKKL